MFSLPSTLMAPSAAVGTIDGAPRGAQAPLISSAPTPIRPNALIIFSTPAGGAVGTRTMSPAVCRNRNYNTNNSTNNSNPSRGTSSPLLPTPLGQSGGASAGDQFSFRCSSLAQAIATPTAPTPTAPIRSASAVAGARHQNQNHHQYQHQHQHQHQHQQHQQQPQSKPQSKPLSPSGGLNDSLPTQILPHLFVGNQEQTNRETVNKLNIKYILSLGLLPIVSSNNNCCHSSSSSLSSPSSPNKNAATNSSTTTNTTNTTSNNYNVTTSMAASQSQQQQQQQAQQILMPTPNSSVDFKIRIRSNTPTPCSTTLAGSNVALSTRSSSAAAAVATKTGASSTMAQSPASATRTTSTPNTLTATETASLLRGDDENKGVKQVRSIHCKCINISDNSDQMLIKFFDEAYAFIDEARRKKCNILIHCLAGISRSPTIAIAYLMRVKSLHWKDAYDMVKRCRPQIDPNLNFMAQLRIYNKSLRDETKKLKLATNKRLQI